MSDLIGGSQQVQGSKKEDEPIGGNPVLVGGKSNRTAPTEVSADSDIVTAWLDRKGRLVVSPLYPPNFASATHGPKTTTLTTTSDVALVDAPGAGLSIHVVRIGVSNASATAVLVDIKGGTTIRESYFLAANGGGAIIPFQIPWKLPAATALNGALGAAVTSVRVNVLFYVAS
jgi:hypothetical protein